MGEFLAPTVFILTSANCGIPNKKKIYTRHTNVLYKKNKKEKTL